MKKSFFFLLFSTLLFLPLSAQDYFGDDLPFFEKKAGLYQRWLDAKGMGAVLKVDKVALKKNGMELELFLTLRTGDPDTAAALWTGLEQGFTQQNPGANLSEALFETFARMMEIPAAQGNVQIYIPSLIGTGGYNPCFYIWIWEEGGQVKQEKRINNCKAQPLSVTVRPVLVRPVSSGAPLAVKSSERAQEVFERILAYARNRYERKVCEARYPRVEVENRSDYMLQFSVSDLCREVLNEERKSIWCNLVERFWGPCNDMRRERLEFTFYFNSTDEGYHLGGELTGKFGSGVYRPRKSGYMDMEPDFEEDFLKPYVRKFQDDLKRFLEKK